MAFYVFLLVTCLLTKIERYWINLNHLKLCECMWVCVCVCVCVCVFVCICLCPLTVGDSPLDNNVLDILLCTKQQSYFVDMILDAFANFTHLWFWSIIFHLQGPNFRTASNQKKNHLIYDTLQGWMKESCLIKDIHKLAH